jgi:hypothetical protein
MWNAKDHPGLAIERRFDEAGAPTVATLSHPDLPFMRTLPSGDAAALRGAADAYLEAVRALGVIAPPLPAMAAGSEGGFGWLDITWGDPDAGAAAHVDPRLSYWVGRVGPIGKGPGGTLVLLAGNQHLDDNGRQVCEGGGVGLRVVMHVTPAAKAGVAVRVTSLSVSGWADARRPGAPLPPELTTPSLQAARQSVARSLGFDPEQTSIQGALLRGQGDDAVLELSGVSIRNSTVVQDKRLCTWSTELPLPLPGPTLPWPSRRNCLALQTSAMARRPVRRIGLPDDEDKEVLGRAARRLRRRTTSGTSTDTQESLAGPLPFEVFRPTLDEPTSAPVVVNALPEKLERAALNDVACAHAVLRGDELFSRLEDWGLAPRHVFKLARLPLKMMPRAGFRFQPDGLTTNAMVQATGPGLGLHQQWADAPAADPRPQLEVRFGVASTTRGKRVRAADGTLRTEYRSLAADRRWAWHEFAHVLQFAATGELEFRFAHSVGDALAAIACDPDVPPGDEALRGATFPASRLPRRHDRPALQGWCWCGERSRLRQVAGRGAPLLFGGYFEEQLMSSSLFRLYRAAGGDPMEAGPQAHARRRAAAEYTLYLIVRAIQLLGPATVVPAITPGQFVGALIDADIGTTSWAAGEFGEDAAALTLPARAGGTLHKVIRWAFEQQGLYAADDPRTVVEDVGLPPPVDVYIPGPGARADGGYATVVSPSAGASEPPGWAASSEGIRLEQRRLSVVVDNRGHAPASEVRLTAWSRKLGKQPGSWRRLPSPDGVRTDVPAKGRSNFIVDAPQGAGGHEVLVMVSARGDLSNLDPASGLPCAAKTPPANADALFDLVANDNNLALCRVEID